MLPAQRALPNRALHTHVFPSRAVSSPAATPEIHNKLGWLTVRAGEQKLHPGCPHVRATSTRKPTEEVTSSKPASATLCNQQSSGVRSGREAVKPSAPLGSSPAGESIPPTAIPAGGAQGCTGLASPSQEAQLSVPRRAVPSSCREPSAPQGAPRLARGSALRITTQPLVCSDCRIQDSKNHSARAKRAK